MRGEKVRIPPRKTKLDLLIVAARYEGAKLVLAKGYEVLGQVWSDVKLYSRDELISQLQAGLRVGYGRSAPLATDFNVEGQLKLEECLGESWILSGDQERQADDLGVPIF